MFSSATAANVVSLALPVVFKNADNTLSMPDHWNHIHVGWRPMYGANKAAARQIDQILEPDLRHSQPDRLNHIHRADTVPTIRSTA